MAKADCSELALLITDIAMKVSMRPGVRNLNDAISEMGKIEGLEDIPRDFIVTSIVEATAGVQKNKDQVASAKTIVKREARREKRLTKALEDLETHLEGGTLPETKQRTTSDTAESAILKEKTKEVRQALSQSAPAIKKRLEKSIAEFTRRIEQHDILPRTRKTVIPKSAELETLQFQRDKLRTRINKMIRAEKPPTVGQIITTPFRLFRSVWTAYDVSAVGRQGLFLSLGHPILAKRAGVKMFRALVSEEFSAKVNKGIIDGPNAQRNAKMKLEMSDIDGAMNAKEEEISSEIAEKIPGIRASNRAFTTYLNVLRDEVATVFQQNLARNKELTQKESEAIGNLINIATGKGATGKGGFARSAETFAQIFFAPRLVLSRFQLLFGQPFLKGGSSVRVRVLIAKEYAKFLTGVAAMIMLGRLAGGEFEEDPRSSDFGKLKFGNTRVDIMGGISQVAVLTARLSTGKTKSTRTGELRSIRGDADKFVFRDSFDVISDFTRTKFSPLASTIVDAIVGTNVVGESVDYTTLEGLRKITTNLITPLSTRDMVEAMKEEGFSEGAALSLLSLLGFGMMTYDNSRKDKKPKAHTNTTRRPTNRARQRINRLRSKATR